MRVRRVGGRREEADVGSEANTRAYRRIIHALNRSQPKGKGRPDPLTLAVFGMLVVLIGANLVAIRFTDRELPPFWGAGVRFAVAAVLFAAMALVRRAPLPRGSALVGALLYGLIGIAAFFAFTYWGLVHVHAAVGAIMFSLTPLLTLFLAVAVGLERFRWRVLAGGTIAALGVAVVFGEQMGANVPMRSLLSLLAAASCGAGLNIIVKRFPPTNPVATNAVAMTVGAVVLFAVSVVSGEARPAPAHGATWAALIYLITLGTVAVFLLLLFLLKHWLATSVAYQFVLTPFVAAGLGAWLENESVAPIAAVGAALVLVGVYVGALAPAE
jgi:drug/metabolite transporter (DMT)-like permease